LYLSEDIDLLTSHYPGAAMILQITQMLSLVTSDSQHNINEWNTELHLVHGLFIQQQRFTTVTWLLRYILASLTYSLAIWWIENGGCNAL